MGLLFNLDVVVYFEGRSIGPLGMGRASDFLLNWCGILFVVLKIWTCLRFGIFYFEPKLNVHDCDLSVLIVHITFIQETLLLSRLIYVTSKACSLKN